MVWFGLSLALWRAEAVAQDTLTVKFSLRTSDFRLETQDGYDVIIPLHDKMSHMSIPGHPQLPTWNNYPVQEEIPLEDEGPISLKLYDPSGRLAMTLFSENKTAGYYDFSWEPDLPAGLYFLRMSTANKALTSKIILR